MLIKWDLYTARNQALTYTTTFCCVKEVRYKRAHIALFHLYEIQVQAKLIYDDGLPMGRGMTGKRHDGTLWRDRNSIDLDDGYRGTHLG